MSLSSSPLLGGTRNAWNNLVISLLSPADSPNGLIYRWLIAYSHVQVYLYQGHMSEMPGG